MLCVVCCVLCVRSSTRSLPLVLTTHSRHHHHLGLHFQLLLPASSSSLLSLCVQGQEFRSSPTPAHTPTTWQAWLTQPDLTLLLFSLARATYSKASPSNPSNPSEQPRQRQCQHHHHRPGHVQQRCRELSIEPSIYRRRWMDAEEAYVIRYTDLRLSIEHWAPGAATATGHSLPEHRAHTHTTLPYLPTYFYFPSLPFPFLSTTPPSAPFHHLTLVFLPPSFCPVLLLMQYTTHNTQYGANRCLRIHTFTCPTAPLASDCTCPSLRAFGIWHLAQLRRHPLLFIFDFCQASRWLVGAVTCSTRKVDLT